MKNVVFDIESDGLLPNLTRLHSLVILDIDTKEMLSCADQEGFVPIRNGLQVLSEAKRMYGHNVQSFDIPAIRKVYPHWTYRGLLRDTLITSRMVWAHVKDSDYILWRRKKLPPKLIGSHSLAAWGFRMGILKGNYGDQEGAWEKWTREMQVYCEQDCVVTRALVKLIRRSEVSREAVETEHELTAYLARQEANGFPFDMDAATQLQSKLTAKREVEAAWLRKEFGSWTVDAGEFIPKRDNKTRGYKAGVPVMKHKTITFKPSSRDHISNRLQVLYGWKPTEFNEGDGKPTIDDGILGSLNYPPVPHLLEHFLLSKRLGAIAEGKQAWLKLATKESPEGGMLTGLVHIHGHVNSCGAVTQRASHSNPNMTQVPKVTSLYGPECRGLFHVPPGWKQMGADASGLELRCLAHYMAKYDGGAYGKIILEGNNEDGTDIHSMNRNALGELISQDKAGRDQAKTFIYAYLYGAGDEKLGSIIAPTATPERQKSIGKKLRATFEKNIPALGYLSEAVKIAVAKNGYVTLIDGRRAYIRSEHAALNTLLQGTGAVICKRWIVEFNRRMVVKHGEQGWRGQWAALVWAHDEVQIAVRPKIANDVCAVAVSSIEAMTEHFRFRIPLTGEAKLGSSWADTH